MNKIIIRPLGFSDFPQWLPLWNENNLGHRDEAVTTNTWERLCDSNDNQIQGLCALIDDKIVGIVHYIIHPTTGSIKDICYMQDVFVTPDFRKKGIGKKLVRAVAQEGKKQNWARMYWLTPEDNESAKLLYKKLGNQLNFAFYVLPIN